MTRVLLAKPGLDGHDRGIRVIAMALRDAGMEVVYLGLRQSVEDIVAIATEEGVDVIGISVLSGAHMTITKRLLESRRRASIDRVAIVVGGTIPTADAAQLRAAGVADVFPVGTPLDEVVAGVQLAAVAPEGAS